MLRYMDGSINLIQITIAYFDIDVKVAANESATNYRRSAQEKAAFKDFVNTVIGYLDQRNFDIIDSHGTNRSENFSLSHYVSFYPVDLDGKVLPKWLIHFRLSDHNGSSMSYATQRYYNRFSNANKRSEDLYQLYKHIDISVGHTNCAFDNYSEALEFIAEYLNNLQLTS